VLARQYIMTEQLDYIKTIDLFPKDYPLFFKIKNIPLYLKKTEVGVLL
jgi:hypothetical protein